MYNSHQSGMRHMLCQWVYSCLLRAEQCQDLRVLGSIPDSGGVCALVGKAFCPILSLCSSPLFIHVRMLPSPPYYLGESRRGSKSTGKTVSLLAVLVPGTITAPRSTKEQLQRRSCSAPAALEWSRLSHLSGIVHAQSSQHVGADSDGS